MTDDEFDDWYTTLTEADKLQWLFARKVSIIFRDKPVTYGITSPEDWDKMIEQEMYEEKTGKQ